VRFVLTVCIPDSVQEPWQHRGNRWQIVFAFSANTYTTVVEASKLKLLYMISISYEE